MKTAAFIVSALAAALTTIASSANADDHQEKCYGVAKAGQNDCKSATHACAGTSTTDAQPDAWIYVPTGMCERLAGGSLEPKG